MTDLEKLIADYYQDMHRNEVVKYKWLAPDKIKDEKQLKRAKRRHKQWLKANSK